MVRALADFTESDSDPFVACADSTIKLLSLARRVAKCDVPVLITGETGTGKECVAKYIHQHAFERKAPYIGVNCAAIPESMLEAILFGYEKGAFTGAVASQPGKFEQANGGTLLLDEIGDMPLALQAKILRVLQEQEVERLGSQQRIKLNIRLLASTNKDLQEEIAAGRFRQDLYYRLSVVPIHIASLRERRPDILPLAERFMQKYQAFSLARPALTASARHALQQYAWPGNVRELENVMQRGLIMSGDGVVDAGCLGIAAPLPVAVAASSAVPIPVSSAASGAGSASVLAAASGAGSTAVPALASDAGLSVAPASASATPLPAGGPIKQHGRHAEFQYILDLLRCHQGNKSRTAESLGITPRALRYRLASMRQQGFDASQLA